MDAAPTLRMPRVPLLAHARCAPWTWFTYPHSNGFLEGGRSLVLGRFDGQDTTLVRRELASGREEDLFRLPGRADRLAARWYDISLRHDRLVTVVDGVILMADLAGDCIPREVHRAAPGATIHELPAISADGARLVLSETTADGTPFGRTRVSELHLASGRLEPLLAHDWLCNHFHYCPADEAWLGYAHEGDTTRILDRMWAWHRDLAPQGRCVFDQASDVPGVPLCIGHERWMFHRPGAVTVAYGVSPHGPRGIWEISVDGRPPRLVSGGERDLHVNIDRVGRHAVLDTSGSLDCAGSGWANNDERSDIVLLDMASGERSWLARTAAAGLGFAGRGRHPFHAHPHFGPDGRTVVFNDYGADSLPAVSIVNF